MWRAGDEAHALATSGTTIRERQDVQVCDSTLNSSKEVERNP